MVDCSADMMAVRLVPVLVPVLVLPEVSIGDRRPLLRKISSERRTSKPLNFKVHHVLLFLIFFEQ